MPDLPPIPARLVPAAIALVSALVLGAALVSQYGFGLAPCQLCLWQRWPYVAAILLGLLGAAFADYPAVRRGAIALSGVAFLVGAGIAAFHAGVEYGWWRGLPGCQGEALSPDITSDDLKAALSGADRAPRCDEPTFVFAGLSMAGWNFLVSLALAAASLWTLASRRA